MGSAGAALHTAEVQDSVQCHTPAPLPHCPWPSLGTNSLQQGPDPCSGLHGAGQLSRTAIKMPKQEDPRENVCGRCQRPEVPLCGKLQVAEMREVVI